LFYSEFIVEKLLAVFVQLLKSKNDGFLQAFALHKLYIIQLNLPFYLPGK